MTIGGLPLNVSDKGGGAERRESGFSVRDVGRNSELGIVGLSAQEAVSELFRAVGNGEIKPWLASLAATSMITDLEIWYLQQQMNINKRLMGGSAGGEGVD